MLLGVKPAAEISLAARGQAFVPHLLPAMIHRAKFIRDGGRSSHCVVALERTEGKQLWKTG